MKSTRERNCLGARLNFPRINIRGQLAVSQRWVIRDRERKWKISKGEWKRDEPFPRPRLTNLSSRMELVLVGWEGNENTGCHDFSELGVSLSRCCVYSWNWTESSGVLLSAARWFKKSHPTARSHDLNRKNFWLSDVVDSRMEFVEPFVIMEKISHRIILFVNEIFYKNSIWFG